MLNIVLDIETQPTKDEKLIERIHADIEPPKTYKKPESIAEWWMTEGEKEKQKAVDMTALDGTFGWIYCIGYKIVDESIPEALQQPAKIICRTSEQVMLIEFNALFGESEFASPVTKAIGYNHVGFDLPFLMRRMIINKVPIHRRLKAIMRAKPWDEVVFDVGRHWQGAAMKMNKASDVAYAMGIPMKTGGISGKDVAQALRDGRGSEVQTYCVEDVDATYQMWRRMR